MQVKVAVECYVCKTADATILALPVGALPHEQPWKLCEPCSQAKTKYGPCWKAIGTVQPVHKDV